MTNDQHIATCGRCGNVHSCAETCRGVNYEVVVQCAANTPAELRRVDVFRVVDTANNAGDMLGFAIWLSYARPDLTGTIVNAIAEVFGWPCDTVKADKPPLPSLAAWLDKAAAEIVKTYPHSPCAFDQFEGVREIITRHAQEVVDLR